jgi:hypothetical protein
LLALTVLAWLSLTSSWLKRGTIVTGLKGGTLAPGLEGRPIRHRLLCGCRLLLL